MALTTVNATLPRKEYTASAGQTVFTVPFEFLADADLKVYQVPSGATPDDTTHLLTLTTHYTVVGAGVSDPGTREITLVTGATLNDTIIIQGEDDIDRDTAFLSTGDLTIAAMNAELNKLILLNKQLSMLIENKALLIRDSAILNGVDLTMPAPEANKSLTWNATADALINASQLDASSVVITAFMETLLDDVTAAAAQATLELPESIARVLQNPQINGAIKDADGDTILNLIDVAAAVNYFTLYHSAAGNELRVEAGGSDTDIDMRLRPKGAGRLRLGDSPGIPIHGMRILDTPENIVSRTTAANWTTFDMSGGGTEAQSSVTDGAKSLILRVSIYGTSNTQTASVRNESAIFVAKSGKAGAPDLVTDRLNKAAHIWWTKVVTAAVDEAQSAQVNDVIVNVDSNGDFQYGVIENTLGGVNDSTYRIELVGYYT